MIPEAALRRLCDLAVSRDPEQREQAIELAHALAGPRMADRVWLVSANLTSLASALRDHFGSGAPREARRICVHLGIEASAVYLAGSPYPLSEAWADHVTRHEAITQTIQALLAESARLPHLKRCWRVEEVAMRRHLQRWQPVATDTERRGPRAWRRACSDGAIASLNLFGWRDSGALYATLLAMEGRPLLDCLPPSDSLAQLDLLAPLTQEVGCD